MTNSFELALGGTTFEIDKFDHYCRATWFTWTEDTGSKANTKIFDNDDELVLFLAKYAVA